MSKRFENMADKSSVSKERIGHTYEISMKSTIKKRIFIIFLNSCYFTIINTISVR